MPKEVYHAYGYVKKAAAVVNAAAGRLPAWKGQLIERVCDEVIGGQLDTEFPLTVGQEWSGYAGALDYAIAEVEHATSGLLALAMGGTAVGTGLNAPPGFGDQVAAQLARLTGVA